LKHLISEAGESGAKNLTFAERPMHNLRKSQLGSRRH